VTHPGKKNHPKCKKGDLEKKRQKLRKGSEEVSEKGNSPKSLIQEGEKKTLIEKMEIPHNWVKWAEGGRKKVIQPNQTMGKRNH